MGNLKKTASGLPSTSILDDVMNRNFPWFYAVIVMLISVMIAADTAGVVDDQAGISEPEQHVLTRNSEQTVVEEETHIFVWIVWQDEADKAFVKIR